MKYATLLLTTILATAQPNPDPFVELNRAANNYLAAYELDQALPLLEQAVAVAPPEARASAHFKLCELYLELNNRDGRNWLTVGLPHLLQALELSNSPNDPYANYYALSLIKISRGAITRDFSASLNLSIAKWEHNLGPLPKQTAIAYEALADFPAGSPEQSQALNACERLTLSREPVASEFAGLLSECAEARRVAHNNAGAIKFAVMARTAASSRTDGRPRPIQTLVASAIEADALAASGSPTKALSAIDAALELAHQSLGPANDLWDRIFSTRLAILDTLHERAASSQAKREWRRWLGHREERRQSARVTAPRVVSDPEFLLGSGAIVAIAAVLVNPDGKASLLRTFNETSPDALSLATKAARTAKFQPCYVNGKAVAGVTTIPVESPWRNERARR